MGKVVEYSCVASARGAISSGNRTFKLVSFAGTKPEAESYASAYENAGFQTMIREAEGSGFAVYALWMVDGSFQDNELIGRVMP